MKQRYKGANMSRGICFILFLAVGDGGTDGVGGLNKFLKNETIEIIWDIHHNFG